MITQNVNLEYASKLRKHYNGLSVEGKDILNAKFGEIDKMSMEEFQALDFRELEKELKYERHEDYVYSLIGRFEQ